MVRYKEIYEHIANEHPDTLCVMGDELEGVLESLKTMGAIVDCDIIVVNQPSFLQFSFGDVIERGTELSKLSQKAYMVEHFMLSNETKIEDKKIYIYSINTTPHLVDNQMDLTRFRRLYLRCVIKEKDDKIRNNSGQLEL